MDYNQTKGNHLDSWTLTRLKNIHVDSWTITNINHYSLQNPLYATFLLNAVIVIDWQERTGCGVDKQHVAYLV